MKKVLFIAYTFPPLGGPGVQRSLKFVKYLKEFGWEPVVLTVGKTLFPINDETLLEEIPKDLEIIRIDDIFLKDYTDELNLKVVDKLQPLFNNIGDLESEYLNIIETKFKELRSLFFEPDFYVLWVKEVIKYIEENIDLSDIDAVYTSVDPFSTGLIGNYLKEEHNIPWIVDFRDEWINSPFIKFNKESIHYKICKELEEKYISSASKVISVTPSIINNFTNKYKKYASKFVTIANGYDEDDFIHVNTDKKQKNKKFTLIYNGNMNYVERNPYTLLRALWELYEENKVDIEDVRIVFVGSWYKQEILDAIDKMDISKYIEWKGYLPHKESLKFASTSDLLLLFIGDNEKFKDYHTGKIFEYMRLKQPILALAPKGSEIEKLIKETETGYCVECCDVEEIKKVLYTKYENWRKNIKAYKPNLQEIKKYERKVLTSKLGEVFNSLK